MAIFATEVRTDTAIGTRVWRDLAQLAVEALAIGVVFSILLALAVLVVVRGARGDEFAASNMPAAQALAAIAAR